MKSDILKISFAWALLAASLAVRTGAQDQTAAATNRTGPPPSQPLTLAEALRLARDYNPELRAARERIAAAGGRAAQARLWSNPDLELSTEDLPVDRPSWSESKDLVGVAQTVPFPGKKALDGKIGGANVRVAEAEFNQRSLELARNVKAAFYQVLTAERLVAVAGELVAVAESSASTARKRVAAGAAPDQEQLRAEIQLEQARTDLAGFQRELAAARQVLATRLGRPDLKDAPVAGALPESANLALLDQGPEQWLARHPGVVAARAARDRTGLELRRARLEPYPDVRLGVAGGREGPGDTSIMEFRVSLPLPIIDRSKGRQQEARANVSIAEAEQAAVEQDLLRAWGTTSQRFRTAVEQVASYRERILPKANEALRLVQTGFEQGKFGFIDLLDTQRTTAEVRLAYQQKLLEMNVAQAELEALLARNPGEPGPTESTPPKKE